MEERLCIPALLTATLSPAAGGLSASVPHLAHGLMLAGAREVHVIGLEDRSDPGAADGWGPQVHVHRSAGPRAFGYAPGLAATLARLAPDVIDVQGLWKYPSLANLRHHHRFGTPYIVTPRGMLDLWSRRRSWWKKRAVRLLFEDSHLRHAACLRATAEMEADHFRSFGLKTPIAIVPNGVETPPLIRRPRYRGVPKRLLYLSRIHPKKGLPILIKAWARISLLHPDWELVIAGPDEIGHTAEVQNLARLLRVQRLHWSGPIYGAAKSDLYRSADLFVLPTHAENFGIVVAEALAHGVPVITTRNAPWEALPRHRCGWWIDLEEHQLAETLNRAMGLPRPELHAMGDRGHAWVSREFGWRGIAARMLELYQWVSLGGAVPTFVQH